MNSETTLSCSSWLVQGGRAVVASHLTLARVDELIPSMRNSHVERF